ncbi:hypothetical protein J7J60_00795 [bacterium]|nr:hypothetical protein [bacterium]
MSTAESKNKNSNLTNQSKKDKKAKFSWNFSYAEERKRTKSYYLLLITIWLILLIWAVLTGNFLFALLLILFFVIILNEWKDKSEISFCIFEDGISLNEKFYPWEEIKNFRIIYEPEGVKRIYFDLRVPLSANISVLLKDQNPMKIRSFLKKYIPEDVSRPYEGWIEKINRWLGL